MLSDRIDEWVATALTEFDGKPLRSVAKGALDLGDLADAEEKAAQEREATALKPLVERLAKALGERVKEVRVTHRLTDSPACLVVGEGEVSGNLERLLKSAGQKAPTVVPILEVNPRHALIRRIEAEPDDRIGDWCAPAVRRSAARRRRPAAGSGRLRAAPQRADVRAGARRTSGSLATLNDMVDGDRERRPSSPRRRGPGGVRRKSLGSRLRGNDGVFVMLSPNVHYSRAPGR